MVRRLRVRQKGTAQPLWVKKISHMLPCRETTTTITYTPSDEKANLLCSIISSNYAIGSRGWVVENPKGRNALI
jgi:hypothetical protein